MAFQHKEPGSTLPTSPPAPPCDQSSSGDNGRGVVIVGTDHAPVVDDDGAPNQHWDTGSMDLNAEAVVAGWIYVPLSQETAQIALDAVRFRRNYARGVTSRLCLHYINSIRKRIDTNRVVNYLYSVDGCVSSEIVESGRCDIYNCRPYTYELQLTQKVVGSDVFIVQSIFKTFAQKALSELLEDSNLDFTTAPQGLGSPEMTPSRHEDALYQSEQSKAWDDDLEPNSRQAELIGEIGQKRHAEYLRSWDSTTTKEVSTQQESMHIQRISMAESASEHLGGAYGPVCVPIIGISAVVIAAIVFAVAIVLTRRRARAIAAECALSDRYPPLRTTLNTTENTISVTSRESMSGGAKSASRKVDLLGGVCYD